MLNVTCGLRGDQLGRSLRVNPDCRQHPPHCWPPCLGYRVWSAWTSTARPPWSIFNGVWSLLNGMLLSTWSNPLFNYFFFIIIIFSDYEQTWCWWQLVLCWCAWIGGWATFCCAKTMLCLDAALPTHTTGNSETSGWCIWLTKMVVKKSHCSIRVLIVTHHPFLVHQQHSSLDTCSSKIL